MWSIMILDWGSIEMEILDFAIAPSQIYSSWEYCFQTMSLLVADFQGSRVTPSPQVGPVARR